MCSSVLSVLVLGGALAFAQPNPKPPTPSFPKVDSDIPGPFHTYNVTGRKRDRYHCLVSENGLNPVVMVVVRGVQVNDPLKYLLTQLDDAAKRPSTLAQLAPEDRREKLEKGLRQLQLGAFVVVVTDNLKDVARDDKQRGELQKVLRDEFKNLVRIDEHRESLEKELEEIERGSKAVSSEKAAEIRKELDELSRQRRLAVGLAAKKKLKKYQIEDKADFFALFYEGFGVFPFYSLTGEQRTEEKAKQPLAEGGERRGSRR